MSITDQQRREMAARLRGGEGLYSTLASMFDPELDANDVLADLIDRPTCENRQTRVSRGGESSFTCSRCGVAFDTMSGEYRGQSFYGIVPRYCPNCGAEVVS